MRAHNNDFKNEIKNYGRQFDDSIFYQGIGGQVTITQDKINYINYNVNTTLLKSVMQEFTFDTTQNLAEGTVINYDCELEDVTGSPIQFRKFNIIEKEERKDTKSYRYTCYDNMIKTMKDYETFLNATSDNTFTTDKNYYELDNGVYTRYTGDRTGNPSSLDLYESAFPMTMRDYINAICTRVGITFANASNTFTNYDKNVLQEHYVDVDLNSMGYTYRDVLDDLAEATGSFICININGQLCIKGITTTNDTIDENYFKDSNVNIGKHYGAINVVVLSRNDSDNLYYPSTIPQDPVEIKINDNPILEQTNRDTFIQGIYNNVNGLEFYLNDFNSTGVMYYEVGDLYNVSIDGTTYPCLMLNDSITRDGGLTEKIYTEEPTTSVTEYKYASDTDKLEKTSRNAYFLADKANGVASMIVEGIGSNGQVTGASVIASINDDTSQLKLIADKIDINGVVSANGNFEIDTSGNVSIDGGDIKLKDNGYLNVFDVTFNDTANNTTHQTSVASSGIFTIRQDSANGIKDSNTLNEDYMQLSHQDLTNNTENSNVISYTGMNVSYEDINDSSNNKLAQYDLNGILFQNGSNTNFSVSNVTGNTTIAGDTTIGGNLTASNIINCVEGGAYNIDTIYDSELVSIKGGSNCPSGHQYGVAMTFPYRKIKGNTIPDYSGQIFFPNGDDNTKPDSMFYRTANGSTWRNWNEVSTIVERGGNSNGVYIKYGDGTMICRNFKFVGKNNQSFTTAYGSVFYNNSSLIWTYPVAFVSEPRVTATAYFQGGLGGFSFSGQPTTTSCSGYLYHFTSYSWGTSQDRVGCEYIAIGYWK